MILPPHISNHLHFINEALYKFGHAFAVVSYREGETTENFFVYPSTNPNDAPLVASSQTLQRSIIKLTWPTLLADGATLENMEGWVWKTHLANEDFPELQKLGGFVVSYFTPHVLEVPKGCNIGAVIHPVSPVN